MDKILLAIQQLLQNAKKIPGSQLVDIKEVIYGDPKKIPESSLPAITLAPNRSTYTQRGSRYDQKTHLILVRLVYNARDFFDADVEAGKSDKVFAEQNAINKMELTTAGTHATAHTSIAGVIANNPQLPLTVNGITENTADASHILDIDYTRFTQSRSFHTYEVILTLEVTTVGNR